MPKILAILWFFMGSVAAFAEDPDYQFRTPFHLQRGSFAAWTVVPDWTAENPKLLVVAGYLWRYEDKDRNVKEWAEVLTGGFTDQNGQADPVFNVRMLRSGTRSDLYAEAIYNFDTRKAVFASSAVVPIWRKLRLGGEVETVFGKGKPDFGLGPKFVLPFKCGPARCSIAGTYFFKRGEDVIRGYTPVNF